MISAARNLPLRRVNSQGTHSHNRVLAATPLAATLILEANLTILFIADQKSDIKQRNN